MTDVKKICGGRFLVVGRAGMDFYADPPGVRLEDGTNFVAALGGSAANIAVALQRLGMISTLMTAVSDDAIGRWCVARLNEFGVSTKHVRVVGGEARNSLAVGETCLEGYQCVIYRNGAADFQMTALDVDLINFNEFSAAIVTGTALALEPSRSAVFRIFERAKATRIPLILDLDYRPYSWESKELAQKIYSQAAQMCDIVVGNDDEFAVMVGNKKDGLSTARELAATSAAIVVYKKGEAGAVTFQDGIEYQTGIYRVQALKPVGAGDAFMGGFIAGLATGRSTRESVMRGSAAAAIVVSSVGCSRAMPTTAQLNSFLDSFHG